MAATAPIGVANQATHNTVQAQEKGLTKEKVIAIAKKVFLEIAFWGGSALAVAFSVVVIKTAFANPVTAIVAIILGFVAYRNRKKVCYVATMYFNTFKNLLGKHAWSNKINDNLILGSIPLENKKHPKEFKEKMKVTDVLSLNENFELETKTFVSQPVIKESWDKEGVNFRHIPMEDVTTDSLEKINQAADFIEEVAKKNGNVYVHCKSGVHRSAAVVVCYLVKYKKFTAQEAINHVKEKRPLADVKLSYIHQYQGYLHDLANKK
jgi:atypical dual specificity phosphatase